MYCQSPSQDFAPFLVKGFKWQKLTAANPIQSLVNDVPEENCKTAIQKNIQLDFLLNQIANWCPVITRNSIINGSISLPDI